MKDKYAVVGNPVAHSKSPLIHGEFAKQTQQQIVYEKQLIELGGFQKDVTEFFNSGGKGLNVTVPFKEEAFQYANQLTERAKLAGAVNTLALQSDGSILGDTTDGAGLVADLKRNGIELTGAKILVVGAGGAVRGVLEPLLVEQPLSLLVVNRTAIKAEELASIFGHVGNISAGGFDAVGDQSFDVIINGTSASLSGDLPPVPSSIFSADSCAYDMMYGKELTPFLKWANDFGCAKVVDGIGMLVGQAAESFYIWRGVMPNIEPVINFLREV